MLKHEQFKTFYDPNTKIWRGHYDMPVYHPEASVGRIILDALNRNPKKIGQICHDSGIHITNEEMARKTIQAAIQLMKLGITQDDVIGIVARNSEYLAPIVFASLLIGTPINASDPSFVKKDIAHMFNLTKPKIIFCDHDVYETVRDAVNEINLKSYFVTFRKKIDGCKFVEDFFVASNQEEQFIAPAIGEGDKKVAIIACSSGTTGPAKGVMVSHAQVLYNFPKIINLTSDDVYINFSTIYWTSGTISLIYGTLCGCTRIITAKPFHAETYFEMIKKYRVTSMLSATSHISSIINSPEFDKTDMSSIRQHYGIGERVPEQFFNKMKNKLINGKLIACYGMTEFAAVISTNASGRKNISVGCLAPGVQVKVVNDDGISLGVNEEGEICSKTKYTFLGYLGLPDEVKTILDDEGWLHTGDIGYLDEEGFLFISGRIKDVIISHTFKISPTEIENVILKLEGVAFVCVVGIHYKASMEFISAVVVRLPNSKITENDVINYVKENVPGYYKQITGGVYFIDSFKRNVNGKIIRKDVKMFAENEYKLRMEK